MHTKIVCMSDLRSLAVDSIVYISQSFGIFKNLAIFKKNELYLFDIVHLLKIKNIV